jgi:hypothetical protein
VTAAPELAQQLDGLVEALLHAGLVALAGQLADHRDAQPAHVLAAGRLDHRRHRRVDGGRVARVVAGDRLVQQRRVEHRAGARPGLVERAGEGDQPVAGDAP